MIKLGPFELDAPFARGGMGEIWRAVHPAQGTPVVIKVITSESARSETFLEAFHLEIETMAALDHPFIIDVLDYGLVTAEAAAAAPGKLIEDSPYLAMEMASGGTLADLYGRVLWPQLKRTLLDILDALSHAHARGVIHRDLKPENVLVMRPTPDATPIPKLTDFGLAHILEADESPEESGRTAGTPAYMPPEQLMARWRDYGPWTDLYALGCMAYQYACHRLPFDYSDIRRLMRAHIFEAIPPLEPAFPVPIAYADWVSRLLAKEPSQRFQTAADAAWVLHNMTLGRAGAQRHSGPVSIMTGVQTLAALDDVAPPPVQLGGDPPPVTAMLDAIAPAPTPPTAMLDAADDAPPSGGLAGIPTAGILDAEPGSSPPTALLEALSGADVGPAPLPTPPTAMLDAADDAPPSVTSGGLPSTAASMDAVAPTPPTAMLDALEDPAPLPTPPTAMLDALEESPSPSPPMSGLPPTAASMAAAAPLPTPPTAMLEAVEDLAPAPTPPTAMLEAVEDIAPAPTPPTAMLEAVEDIAPLPTPPTAMLEALAEAPAPVVSGGGLPPTAASMDAVAPTPPTAMLDALEDPAPLPTPPTAMLDAADDAPASASLDGGLPPTSASLAGVAPAPTPPTAALIEVEELPDDVRDGLQGNSTLAFIDASPEPDASAPGALAGDGVPVDGLPPVPEQWRRAEASRPMQLVGAGLGLYGLRPVPMVAREDERDAIWTALRGVHGQRQAQALVMHGSAGMGKSRLAEWMSIRAQEVGAVQVLRAFHSKTSPASESLSRMLARFTRCLGMSRDEMYRRVQDLLSHLGVTSDPVAVEILTEIMAPCCDWGENDAEEAASPTPSSGRDAILYRYLSSLAARRPVLVWLDDVQWGADALRFVEYALDQQARAAVPIFFLMTANDEALSGHEAARLAELEARETVARVAVDALAPHDHLELIQRLLRFEGSLADRLARRTAGNPLFAIQLVGDWVERGVLIVGEHGFILREGEEVPMPDNVHDIWIGRLEEAISRLDPEERDDAWAAIEVAAALGRDVDPTEWRAACNMGRITIPRRLLPALIACGLARRDELGWSFAHGTLCEGVASHTGDRWAHRHYLCTQMLRHRYEHRQPGVAARYARHMIESGAPDEALEPLLVAANESLNTGDFDQVHAILDQRAEIMTSISLPEDDPRWAESWLCQAGVHVTQGHLDEASDCLNHAAPAARENPGVGAEIMRVRGMIAGQRGESGEGIRALQEAIHIYHHLGATLGVAHCLTSVGSLYRARGQFDEAAQHFEAAIDMFEKNDAPDGIGLCLNGLADICRQMGQLDQASQLLGRAISHLERAGDRAGVAGCLNDLGNVARSAGAHDEAEDYYRQAIERMEALGSQESVVPHNNLGLVLIAREVYGEARVIFEDVMGRFQALKRPGYVGVVHVELLACAAADADWDAWDQHFERGVDLLAEHTLVSDDVAEAAQLAGAIALRAGEAERAQRAFELSVQTWHALERFEKIAEVRQMMG